MVSNNFKTTSKHDADRDGNSAKVPTWREGGFSLGGTEVSADGFLVGVEDVVR